MVDDSDVIAGVADEELATVSGRLAALPTIRAKPAERFAQAVRTLVEGRAQKGWPNEEAADVAVFVLVKYPRRIGEAHGGEAFLDPVAQGTPLLGRLFFSNTDATHGQFIPIPTTANKVRNWLADQDLGDCPFVMVYRGAKEMVTRPAGTDSTARRDSIRDEEPAATVSELMDALRHYHRRRVLTPKDCPVGVWKPNSADRYIPGPNPEKNIQGDLAVALDFWFHNVLLIECEDNTKIGRIDVRLLEYKEANRGWAYWAILELKVIKSFTNRSSGVSESANIAAIVKGVGQVHAYRANRKVDVGRLEIYDLRRDKSVDLLARTDVLDALARCSPPPEIDVWPVFGSSEDARKAGETGSST